jgi:carbon storage regulator
VGKRRAFLKQVRAKDGDAMLVLSRQRDETVMIGDDIQVEVVDIRGDKVRLGITAPKGVSIHRKEVFDAIKRENHAAATLKPSDLGCGKPTSFPSAGGVDPDTPPATPNS